MKYDIIKRTKLILNCLVLLEISITNKTVVDIAQDVCCELACGWK